MLCAHVLAHKNMPQYLSTTVLTYHAAAAVAHGSFSSATVKAEKHPSLTLPYASAVVSTNAYFRWTVASTAAVVGGPAV